MTPPAPNRPNRATTAGRTYLDLQNLARRQHRPTDELHQLFALEGFLDRLTRSDYADQLVLKGGALLAAYDARRPTRDVDIAARNMPGTVWTWRPGWMPRPAKSLFMSRRTRSSSCATDHPPGIVLSAHHTN